MTASTPVSTSRIFVSYRREDAAYPAGWLFDRLVDHFGDGQVFKDVDSIQLGDDFVEVITAAVGSCAVLLTVIGTRWLTVTGETGQRRLDDPEDFVRLEIQAAFARGVRVIPVLVDGAQMPNVTELPASLAQLAHRQALELSPSRFGTDTARLLGVLDRSLTGGHHGTARPPEQQARPSTVRRTPGEGARPPAARRTVAGYWRFWIGLLLVVGGWACFAAGVPHTVGYGPLFGVQHADTYTQVALVTLIILGVLFLGGAVSAAVRENSALSNQR